MNDMSQVKSKPVDELVALLKRMPSDVLNQAAEIITFTRNDRDDLQSQLTQAERRGEEKAREELKSKARDHVAERCDQIAQLQSQLTQSNELASTLKSQWLSMSTQLTQAHKERDEAVAKIIKWGPLVESYELQVKELSAELTQYRVALERCHVALINWHALLRNLKTDYENNSLDVLDQIQSTKSKSLKALELSTPLIEKVRK